MRICFWISDLFTAGGTKSVVTKLSNEMVDHGHDVTILCHGNRFKEQRDFFGLKEEVKVIFVPQRRFTESDSFFRRKYLGVIEKIIRSTTWFDKPKFNNLVAETVMSESRRKRVAEFINQGEYDVVIACARLAMILGMLKPYINKNTKIYGWQHTTNNRMFHTDGLLFWHKESLALHCIKQLDGYVVLNDYDQKEYAEKCGLPVNVIYNGNTFECEQKSLLTSKKFIGVVRFMPEKGVDLMIEAFSIFAQSNSDWRLVIVGTGPLENQMRQLAETLHVDDRIDFAGYQKEIIPYYQDASAYLMTSREEGWGLVIVEALEMGIPVIAFHKPPVDLIVTDGKDGILVPPFDLDEYAKAMLRLAEDYDLRKSMGIYGAKNVRRFSMDRAYASWIEFLNDSH